MTRNLPDGWRGQLLAAGLLAITMVFVWISVAEPMIGWYRSRAENISDQVMIANRMRAITAELPQLEQQTNLQSTHHQTGDAFIDGVTDAIAGATLEQTMQSMASQQGATLSSGEILSPQAQGQYTQIQLRVSLSGTWLVLMRLLAAIGASRPVLLVDDLQISGAQDISQTNNTQMNASFIVIAFRSGNVHPSLGGVDSGSPIAP